MTAKLSDELRQALKKQPDRPLTVEDDQTHKLYVLLPVETYQKVQSLIYDDSDFDPREAYPLIDQAFGGSEGWDAPGMEVYDDYDSQLNHC